MGIFELDLTGNTLNQDKPYYEFNDEKHHDDIVYVKFDYVEKIIDEAIEQQQEISQSQQDCSGGQITAYVGRLPKHGNFGKVQHSRERINQILPG